MLNVNCIHSEFKLNGIAYTNETLLLHLEKLINSSSDFDVEIGQFLKHWLDDNLQVEVKTSGSTGIPKSLLLKKEAMKASALATGNFFNLKPKTTALLCLPISYIAGKMMLVRAMVLGWHIDTIVPKISLDIPDKIYDFSAMIPSQVETNIAQLYCIKKLIIGGGKVSESLKNILQETPCNCFETYGMTETITHIAVKAINGNSVQKNFNVLPGVEINYDDRGCLVIKALRLNNEQIVTNDLVKLHSKTEFEWLGRVDNVINSGGLKLFPEQIEAKLQPFISNRFFIASQKDETFDEVPILVIESENSNFNTSILDVLEKQEQPKSIFTLPHFAETSSGKIQRKKTLELLNKH